MGATVRSYRDLIAWQKAMDLAVAVYKATDTFPRGEMYCLAGQMRRAATSVPSNIAEGQGRGATKEYLRFLRIARGSVQELETQLILAHRLGYVPQPTVDRLLADAVEVSRIVSGFARSLGG